MKAIKRNRNTGDFDMFFDGRYIGSRATYTEAQAALNALAYETLKKA